MAETVKFEPIVLRYSGVFDFEALYRAGKNWYTSVYATVNWETLYKDKVTGPGTHEVEIKLEGYIKWDRYRRWTIKIGYKTWDIKDVVIDGKKFSSGRLQLTIDGYIMYDYDNMYGNKNSKFVKTLGKIYWHLMKKDEDFAVKKKCEKEMYRLQNEFNKILNIPN
jgi:hypothetical protein